MKKIFYSIVFSSLTFTGFSGHASKPFGLGVILFGPTGFSGNYFLNYKYSIDGALAWGIGDRYQSIYLHSTFLYHNRNLLKISNSKLDVYFGGGPRVVSWSDYPGRKRKEATQLGIRGALGTGYEFKDPSIEVFGELSLTMNVVPETDADIDIGLGARYYF